MDKQGSGWRNTPTSKMKGYHLTAQSIVHPLTSSLCLSNQSAPCLGKAVQGALLTTTTIMTREDVRAQLAKNPLVWREEGAEEVAHLVDLWPSRKVIEYVISEEELHLRAIDDTKEWADFDKEEDIDLGFITDDDESGEVYLIAENHRLDLICEMLGITE